MQNLFIITQSADPDNQLLGFFTDWIAEFRNHVPHVRVAALRSPKKNWLRLGWHILVEVPRCDTVFCHMAPIFVILAAPWAKLWGKKVIFWYAHKSVTSKLRLATWLADRIVTSTSEGFRLVSSKVEIVGQGIDMQKFRPGNEKPKPFSLLTIGRIAPVKNLEVIINAVNEIPEATLTIIGEPALPQDVAYLTDLKKLANDRVHFLGKISHRELPARYQAHHIFINVSRTGSLDKTIVEAMASGCTVISSNDAARAFLPGDLVVSGGDAKELAQTIRTVATKSYPELREYAIQHHSLQSLIEKIHGHERV